MGVLLIELWGLLDGASRDSGARYPFGINLVWMT